MPGRWPRSLRLLGPDRSPGFRQGVPRPAKGASYPCCACKTWRLFRDCRGQVRPLHHSRASPAEGGLPRIFPRPSGGAGSQFLRRASGADAPAIPGLSRQMLQALSLQLQALFQKQRRNILIGGGLMGIYLLWRTIYKVAGAFINLSESMLEYEFLARESFGRGSRSRPEPSRGL